MDSEKTVSAGRSKQVRVKLGIWTLFLAIFLVYIFSGLKFLYVWSVEASLSQAIDWEGLGVLQFWDRIGYDKNFRYSFIYVIIGIFVLALILIVSGGPEREQKPESSESAEEKPRREEKVIRIIEDDVILVDRDVPKPELMDQVKYLSVDDIFTRQGVYRNILKVANLLALGFMVIIASVFLISATINPAFMYSDIGHILFDTGMAFELAYFLLRCPDFVKSLASTGFERAYLKKWHLHESALGLLLVLGGIFLVINGAGEGAYFERMTGIILLILGGFLAGRDWKDFARGKFFHD